MFSKKYIQKLNNIFIYDFTVKSHTLHNITYVLRIRYVVINYHALLHSNILMACLL